MKKFILNSKCLMKNLDDDCYKLVNAARDLQTEAKKEKKELKTVNG